MSKLPEPPRKRKRKRKIREFDQTDIGFLLKHEAPLEYELIYNRICGKRTPSADLIEQVGYSSSTPLFRKPKFRRALIEYRKTGLRCGIPRKPNPKTEIYYKELRERENSRENL